MSNEPVAWILKENPQIEGEVIPLYTHPADESFDRTASHMAGEYVSYKKMTLTDEEIYKIYCEVEDTKCPSDDFEYMMFARAILRKAQEK